MNKKNDDRQNIVVVGFGAAGSRLTHLLTSQLDTSKYNLVVINPRPFYIIYLAAARLVVSDADRLQERMFVPVEDVLKGKGVFIQSKVTQIHPSKEREGGEVMLENGECVSYRALVLATGASWDGPLSFPNTVEEVSEYVNNSRQAFKTAEDIVLVGAGAVGCELAGEIKDIWPLKKVTIVHGDSLPLSGAYPDKFRRAMELSLRRRDINFVLGDYVDGIPSAGATEVSTRNGLTLKSNLMVSTRGQRFNTDFIKASLGSDVIGKRDLVKVQPTLQVVGHKSIFAIGDIIDWEEQKQAAKAGKHADIAAKNVIGHLDGTHLGEYKGSTEMIVVTNGKDDGVGFMGILWGIVLGGWFARLVKSRTAFRSPLATAPCPCFPDLPDISYPFPLSSTMTQILSISPLTTMLPQSRISQSGAASQSTISTASAASLDTAKRSTARREGNFIFKHGQRHHTYDSEKAPYPLCYDRAVLDLESLGNKFVQTLKGSVSFFNFEEDGRPQRVLDLGCGLGTWVIDAAKEWRHCEFVGFDLVNVQIPLTVIEPSVARRIEWRHGNFLTTKLPFEDDEFDHVHISMIAKGVPENKWGNLFEEINRVLAPGGTCEIVEDDVVFPVLPKWFTQALRPKPKTSSIHLPNGLQGLSPADQPQKSLPPHDHALLESLYSSVFEHRFINTKPTAVLPSYFTTYFRQVTIGPVVHFPMPPLAPLQPLPPQIVTTYVLEPDTDTINPRLSTYYPTPVPAARPTSYSFSSTISSYTSKSGVESILSNRPRTASSATTAPDSPTSYIAPSGKFLKTVGNKMASPSPRTPPTPPSPSSPSQLPRNRFMLDNSLLGEKETASQPRHLFPSEKLQQLSNRYLAMQLYVSCQNVLGCQEAMWEELKDRIRNRKHELLPYGWDDDDELEELQSRTKFEKLVDRFKSDMHLRISLWYSLTDLGWNFPEREPLTKAELVQEQRIRANMLEARKQARPEEFDIPCRSVRVLVGCKL